MVRREARGLVELPRLAARAPSLSRMPRGDGTPVLVLPGRSADDLSTVPLRAYLRSLGHAPTGWGLGVNDGDLARLVPLVADRVVDLAATADRPIPLVGQSMGGSIARAVARVRPDAVSRIITIGSPIMARSGLAEPGIPTTVIYSKADQIVPPRWALRRGDTAEVVEVRSAHLTMGIDPDVWAIVAERLAR